MKLGVIADIHGNEPALRAVLDDAARHRVDRWWVLGDLVLFGPRPGGATVLGVHASPGADDGPAIDPHLPDEQLRGLLAGCGTDVVVGGHTHYQADRLISGIRALNPGSTAMPRPTGQACWLLLQDRGRGDLHVEHRTVPYDAGAVARDLHRRRHPSAAFIGAVLTGQREQYRTPSATAR
jgi:predicted phosphodiesterase